MEENNPAGGEGAPSVPEDGEFEEMSHFLVTPVYVPLPIYHKKRKLRLNEL
jgi:hypothetical protein